MKKLVVKIFLFFLLSISCHATKFTVEPIVGYVWFNGDNKQIHGDDIKNVDCSFSAFNFGGRIGANVSKFWLGMEVILSFPGSFEEVHGDTGTTLNNDYSMVDISFFADYPIRDWFRVRGAIATSSIGPVTSVSSTQKERVGMGGYGPAISLVFAKQSPYPFNVNFTYKRITYDFNPVGNNLYWDANIIHLDISRPFSF